MPPRSRIRVRRPDRLRPPRPVLAADPVRRPPGRAVDPPAVPRLVARCVRVRDRQPPVRDQHRATHRPRPRLLPPSWPRPRRHRRPLLRRRRSSRLLRHRRPPSRHRASRRPSSRPPHAPPRRRVPVPYRGRRVSPLHGRTSVPTSVVASRPLAPTSPFAPTVRHVPRPRSDPPLREPPVRVSPARGRVPVAPAVCLAAPRARVAPAAHPDRVTTHSLPRRAWASRGLPARPAAMPPVPAGLVRRPAAVGQVALAVPVGRVPVVAVAACPACRARTRP